MTLKDFIRNEYPAALDIIELRKRDPLELISSSDIFEYDLIAEDDSGRRVKMLICDDKGGMIPVHELLSYSSVEEVPDDLKLLFTNYTSKYKFTKLYD